MSVNRKLKQCRTLSLCYCLSTYINFGGFLFSFPVRALENGSPVVFWLSAYSLGVCLFSHYLVKRVWYSRPKFYSLAVIAVIGVSTLVAAALCTWSFVYFCGGYIHGVKFSLPQKKGSVDVTERLATTTTLCFVVALFELLCIIITFLLYQRLNIDWAKAAVWLRKESPERFPTNQHGSDEKYIKYNDPDRCILEGQYNVL